MNAQELVRVGQEEESRFNDKFMGKIVPLFLHTIGRGGLRQSREHAPLRRLSAESDLAPAQASVETGMFS